MLTEARTSISGNVSLRTCATKGDAVVRKNIACIEAAAAGIHKVPVPDAVTDLPPRPPAVDPAAPAFVREVTAKMIAQNARVRFEAEFTERKMLAEYQKIYEEF